MKKIALCLALAAIYGTAQANTLNAVLDPLNPGAITTYDNPGTPHNAAVEPVTVTGNKTVANFGSLSTDGRGTFTATYLGEDSGHADAYKFTLGSGATLTESSALGATISRWVTGGLVNFQFVDTATNQVFNDGTPGPANGTLSFVFLSNPGSGLGGNGYYCDTPGIGCTKTNHSFQYILGFDDSAKGTAAFPTDWNDFVVGVNYVPAVPLPAALPLMASAVGLIGVGMRRRKPQ